MRPVALTMALLCTAQAASPAITTPAAGTPLRTSILDSLRVPVMRHLGLKQLSFRVSHLLLAGPWAFVQARPLDAAYNAVSDPLTNAPEVWALLQKTPAGWQVRRWAMPTDVVSEDWEKEFPNVPKKLWPHHRWSSPSVVPTDVTQLFPRACPGNARKTGQALYDGKVSPYRLISRRIFHVGQGNESVWHPRHPDGSRRPEVLLLQPQQAPGP